MLKRLWQRLWCGVRLHQGCTLRLTLRDVETGVLEFDETYRWCHTCGVGNYPPEDVVEKFREVIPYWIK